MAVLAVLLTGVVSVALHSHPGLSDIGRFWGLLVAIALLMVGGVCVRAIATSRIEMPDIDSLVNSTRCDMDEDDVAWDLAEAYKKAVKKHRQASYRVATNVNCAAGLLLLALALISIYVFVVAF